MCITRGATLVRRAGRRASLCRYGIDRGPSDTPLPDNGGVAGAVYWAPRRRSGHNSRIHSASATASAHTYPDSLGRASDAYSLRSQSVRSSIVSGRYHNVAERVKATSAYMPGRPAHRGAGEAIGLIVGEAVAAARYEVASGVDGVADAPSRGDAVGPIVAVAGRAIGAPTAVSRYSRSVVVLSPNWPTASRTMIAQRLPVSRASCALTALAYSLSGCPKLASHSASRSTSPA